MLQLCNAFFFFHHHLLLLLLFIKDFYDFGLMRADGGLLMMTHLADSL
jgi:hypothetical protein